MGIIKGIADIMCHSKSRLNYQGTVLTLGKQNIIITEQEWKQMVAQNQYDLLDVPISTEYHIRYKNNFITSNYFFRALGFQGVQSIDVSNYENANYIFDMNSQNLDVSLHGKFDCVFNGSTIEHIFHLPNVLRNIFHLLKVGGIAIQISPVNQMVDDGFYQISPTLFVDYHTLNHYEILVNKLHYFNIQAVEEKGTGIQSLRTSDRFEDYDYDQISGKLARFEPFGGAELCQTFFVVRKTSETTVDLIPHQRRYSSKDYWQEHLIENNYIPKA